MKKTATPQELEARYATRAQMIENLLSSTEAINIWQNCYSYNYMRIVNARACLRTRAMLLWELASDMNNLTQKK